MTSLSDLEPKCLAWVDLAGCLSFNNGIEGPDYFQEISFEGFLLRDFFQECGIIVYNAEPLCQRGSLMFITNCPLQNKQHIILACFCKSNTLYYFLYEGWSCPESLTSLKKFEEYVLQAPSFLFHMEPESLISTNP